MVIKTDILNMGKDNSKMLYNYKEVEHGKEYLAYGYKMNNTEKSMKLKTKPYKCIIDGDRWHGQCIKLNKKGEKKRKKIVNIWSRSYAETEDEAILEYNKLIDTQISFLKSLILKCEQDKLGIE